MTASITTKIFTLLLHLSTSMLSPPPISVCFHNSESVQECTRAGVCWHLLLRGSVRHGHQSHLLLLQRADHAADGRLLTGTASLSATTTSLCTVDFLILWPRLRWQTWQFSIWPSAPCTCECLICPAAFFSRMIPPHTWWGFVLHSAPSPWPAAATSPSKTWQRSVVSPGLLLAHLW